MTLTIVPMVAPKVLEDMLRVMGKPNRVRLTGSYEDGEKAAALKIEKKEGFIPNHVRIGLEVSADSMTVKQILVLYQKNYADFNDMLSQRIRTRERKRKSNLSIKELVWFKNDVKDGVIQGDKEHYYFTFDRYHFHGRISTKMEPALIQKILNIMMKYNLNFPVNLGG